MVVASRLLAKLDARGLTAALRSAHDRPFMIERYESRRHRCEESRPTFFRLANAEDRARLEQVLKDDPRIEIFDTYRGQVEELIEIRNPAKKLPREELTAAVDRALATRPLEEHGVWAHFPWSARLVHLLDEADFVELRTDRNLYKITRAEQETLRQKRVGVVGLSVGQSVALTMAMERSFGELRMTDFDRLGLSNLNRLRAGVHELEVGKVTLTTRQIAEIDPYLNVVGFAEGLTEKNMDTFFLGGGKLDLVIDECDDLTMKILLRRRARELQIPVLMETSDKGLVDIERFDLEPSRPIFHGLIDALDPERLRGLSTEDKVPFVVKIIGETTVSHRMIASMMEVGQSIKSWPQLASAVVMGGGVAADVVRRMLLGQLNGSGRFFVDLDALIADSPEAANELPTTHVAAPQTPTAPISPTVNPAVAPVFEAMVTAGIAAPSGGNCQPWKWVADGGSLTLHHDLPRSESFLDFEATAAMLALGAATENAVLAAHAQGREVRVEWFPTNTAAPRAVARFTLAERPTSDTESHQFDALHAAISERHSNRKLGKTQPLASEAVTALLDAAQSVPGARLQLLTSAPALSEIGSILGAGDRVRFLSKQLHREMMSEIRWTREEVLRTRDGIDIETLELSPSDRAGVSLCRSWPAMQIVRRIGGGFALEKLSKKAVAASSAVGLLTMPSASARDFLLGGRALERTWLTATALGIAFQPMSSLPYLFARLVRGKGEGLSPQHIDELQELRTRYEAIFELTPATAEILVFRLAYAEPASHRALRRSVADVLSLPRQ